jgi:hypothetical protein
MRSTTIRAGLAALVGGLLLVLPSGAGAAPLVTAPGPACSPVPTIDDRCETWTSSFDMGANTQGFDFVFPPSLAMSPAGDRAYVAGSFRPTGTTLPQLVVLAYDVATGAQRWNTTYAAPAGFGVRPSDVSVSPDGTRLFVTSTETRSTNDATDDSHIITQAVTAASGAREWTARYDRPGGSAHSVAVASDANSVYVVGQSISPDSGADFVTLGYNAATGAQRWTATSTSSGAGLDIPSAIGIVPGGTVVVTGTRGVEFDYDSIADQNQASFGGISKGDYATIAYNALTGAQRWDVAYDGPAHRGDVARSVASAPDGSRIFVTGYSQSALEQYDIGTIAYDTATGQQAWVTRTAGPDKGFVSGDAITVNPAGTTVFVAGGRDRAAVSEPTTGRPEDVDGDIITVALNSANGAQRWSATYGQPGYLVERATDIVANNSKVYVTGLSARLLTATFGFATGCDPTGECYDSSFSDNESQGDFATVAYDAAGGTQSWAARFNENPAGTDADLSSGIALSPNGQQVLVTGIGGRLAGVGNGIDYEHILTAAYGA